MARHRSKVSRGRRHTVYTRDNWTCQDCGLKFDPQQTFTDRVGSAPYIRVPGPQCWIALEIDHVNPLYHGGTNDIQNLRAACSTCNRRKSFNPLEVVDAS